MAIRQAIRQLAPPSDDDFATRLAATVGAVEEEFGHSVQLEISPAASAALDTLGPARSGLLTKVAREALVNAAKHAGPCQLAVRVTVTRRGRLLLSVTDDGVGVGRRRREAGYGMAAMRRAVREHGGDLRLHAAATGGTRVSASLPL
jgi:signal transduction histidine kinase